MAQEEKKEEEKMEKIVVVIRVRPLHKGEATQRSPWKLSSKSIASSKTCRPSVPCHSFTYDRVYGTKSTTLEIYDAQVKGIITSAVSGVSGTIIAYGQSGSGKTCTLRGLPEESGILLLAVQDVFKKIQEEKDREFLVRVSYFELENEELIDLFASKNQKLDVHEDIQGSIVVAGLREEIVVGTEQVLALLEYADARRSAGRKNATDCRRTPHSFFQMIIESRLDNQESLLIPQATYSTIQISVLNLVEVAAAKSGIVDNDGTFLEEMKPDKSLITLDTVMTKLSENAETKGDPLPYPESKLTYLLKASLGGNARTCFICHISPAMVHMNGTVETLMFATKATMVTNCLKSDEVWRNRPILKRQKREMEELRNKLKEEDHSQELEDAVNHRNALLMIELEREQMSIELLGNASLLWGSDTKDQNENQTAENLLQGGDFRFEKRSEMQQDDHSTNTQTKAVCGYIEEFCKNEELQDVDHLSRQASGKLWSSPRSGNKRKRRSFTGTVTEKFEQVDLLFQSKMARGLNCLKAEGIAERQLMTELRNLIEIQVDEHQKLLAHKDDDRKKLLQKIAEMEKEKVMMEKRLCEQERTSNEAVESPKDQFAAEGKRVHEDLPVFHSDNVLNENFPRNGEKPSETSQNEANSKDVASFEDEVQETGLEILGSVVKQHTEAQSCLSQESEEQQNVLNETEGKNTSTKRKSKANKVYRKYQNFQGRSENSKLKKELAVAKETISALKDERDGLRRDLKQIRTDESRSEREDNVNVFKEDINGGSNSLHLLAAAVGELKAEVESTLSITDTLLELVLDAFETLNADLKSFQEGVAELKVLSCATADLSESLEKAKLQLVALRHGKLSSEKELHSMKSELAKLECVVERQSGVLRVLSDNESLLNEISSVRAAMKEAATASELRLLDIQQEYKSKLEKLESQRENWKQENMQLEEKYSDIQSKLHGAQAEVHTLTQALEKKSELEKKQTDMQLKFNIAETDVLRLTQALEKSKVEKKKKYSKSRQSTTEAEILRLTHSLGEKAGLQEEIRRLHVDLSSSQTEVERLEREVEDNDKARQEILIKLKSSEHTVVELTVELQDKARVEAEQGNKLVGMENEVFKVTKLLENTLSRVESQQRELIISRGKAENLARQQEEMNTLENNYSKTLDRLVQSETEVARLTKIITSQLEDKSILEQDHTNFIYKLESSEIEVTSLAESLSTVLEEKANLEKELKGVAFERSKSESQVARLTENLGREKRERKGLEESHQETLDKLSKQEEQVKLLGGSILELKGKLTKEQQEKEAVEEIYQEMLEKLTRDQEVRKNWEERNLVDLASPTHTQQELEVQEAKRQELLDNLASLETKVMQLTEKLAGEAREKSELENKLQDIRDHLTQEQEQRKILEEKNEDILEQLVKGHEEKDLLVKAHANCHHMLATAESKAKENQGNALETDKQQVEREQLNKAYQDTLEKLVASQSEVAQLSETLTVKMQECNRLETEYLELINNHRKEEELEKERNKLEIESAKTLHEAAKEQETGLLLGEFHQTVLQSHQGSEAQLIQMTESLDREVREKKRLEEDCQQILETLQKEQKEMRVLEIKNEEILANMIRDEQQKRELLEESNQTLIQSLAGSEAQVDQLTNTLTREMGEKNGLEEHHQEVLATLSKEQQERRALEAKYEQTLKKLTMAIEERDVLDKAQQNILHKLAISEAKVGELAETLTTEVQDRLRLEHRHQETIDELTSDREEKLVQSNKETAEKFSREKEKAEMLKKDHQNCLDMLAGFEGKVVELKESIALEVQNKDKLELEYRKVFSDSERLKTEVAVLTQRLTRELQSKIDLENHNSEVLAQLASSNAEVARVNANLADEVAEKEKLTGEYRTMLAQFDTSKLQVENLTNSIEETPQLKGELHNLQLKLAVSEAKLLSQAEEQRTSTKDEHKLLLIELDATRAEIQSLSSHKERLQHEKVILLEKISTLEAEILRWNDELRDKGQVEKQKDVTLKTEVSNLEIALREKSKPEGEEHKLQLEILSQQGEISKLTTALRVSRKVLKEQKTLIRNLTTNQAEVLRLTNALGGRSGSSSKVHVEQNTATDPSITGIPCGHCGPQSLHEDQIRLQKKLVSTEAEVARLLNVIQEKTLVENKWASLQLELSAAQAEIARLTAALEENSRLDEHLRRFQHKLSEAGLLRSRNGLQCSLKEFASELLKIASNLEELKREVESKEVELAEKERNMRDKEIGSDVDYESLSTIITLRETERDELRNQCLIAESKVHDLRVEIEQHKEQCALAKSKVHDLSVQFEKHKERCALAENKVHDLSVEIEMHKQLCALAESKVHGLSVAIEKHKELERAEKKLKARCHKAERDATDFRAKLEKLEEATSWLARDKNLLEERLNCCEVQLAAAREATRSTSKELEMSHHQLHVRTAQHQSEMGALCDELSMKKAQKAELEAELNRLLGQPHRPLQSNSHFRLPQWSFPKGPGPNLDPSWGDGQR